jgi:hypothetical protein
VLIISVSGDQFLSVDFSENARSGCLAKTLDFKRKKNSSKITKNSLIRMVKKGSYAHAPSLEKVRFSGLFKGFATRVIGMRYFYSHGDTEKGHFDGVADSREDRFCPAAERYPKRFPGGARR